VKNVPVKAVKLPLTPKEFADEEGSRWGLALKKAGLFQHEAETVVKMMRKDLLEANGTRAIYLANDKIFDEMCSVKVSPAPVRKVRISVCAIMVE